MKTYYYPAIVWSLLNFVITTQLNYTDSYPLVLMIVITQFPLVFFFLSEFISEWSFLSFGFMASLAKDSGQIQDPIVVICFGWFFLLVESLIFLSLYFSG